MIKTSNYKNFKSSLYKTVSISGDRGRGEDYNGSCYPKLAPKLSFWKKWHENIGVLSQEANNKFYIEEYYKQVLSILNPEKVYNELEHSILLCYEDNNEFCHRHIVAAWLELFLDKQVAEVVCDDFKIVEVNRPEYIKEILESVIRENINMRGFTSLHALYLFEKSEYLENEANKLEEKTGKSYAHYRQEACYLRCDADEAEVQYRCKRKSELRK